MKRLAEALMALALCAVLIRGLAWLLAPALPLIVVLALLAAIVYRIVASPRFRGADKFFKER